MKLKGILLALLVLTVIISPVSSADMEVTFGGEEVEEPSFIDTLVLKIVGDFEGGDGRSTYVLPPGQTYNIMLTIQNDGPGTDPTWYKAYAYQGSATNLLWQSGYVWIEYGEWYWDESWMFAYTTPTTPGTYTIYLESERGDPNTGIYGFDDIVSFNVLIEGAGTPTPTPTATPYPTPTPTATPPSSFPPDVTPTPTATATVQPSNIPPAAKITYEDMGNGKIVLRGTESTDSDGTIEEFKWHLNDQYINGQSTFTHVFDEAGTHTIRLDVIDNDGGSSSAILIVTLQESENSAGVVIGNVDDTQAASQPATGASGGQQPRGIWIEDGALMMPGFEALFAIAGLIMVYWNVHRRREE